MARALFPLDTLPSARAALERRTAELRCHDLNSFEAWLHLPFEVWPAPPILSFVEGTGWEHLLDPHNPTGAELRALITEAQGYPCEIVPESRSRPDEET